MSDPERRLTRWAPPWDVGLGGGGYGDGDGDGGGGGGSRGVGGMRSGEDKDLEGSTACSSKALDPSPSYITKLFDYNKNQDNLPQTPSVDLTIDSSTKTQAKTQTLDRMETGEKKYLKWKLGKSNCLEEYASLSIDDDFLNIEQATTLSFLLERPDCVLKTLFIEASSRAKVDQEESHKCRLMVIAALRKCLSITSLTVCGSNEEEVNELCMSLAANKVLENLVISIDGPLTNYDAQCLSIALKENHTLKSFTLQSDKMSFLSAACFGEILVENSSLEELKVDLCVWDKFDLKFLLKPLISNKDGEPYGHITLKGLHILNLNYNGGWEVAQMLRTNKTLTHFSMINACLSIDDICVIVDSLKINKTLHVLNLEGCKGLDEVQVKVAFLDLLVNYNFTLSTIKYHGMEWNIEAFMKSMLEPDIIMEQGGSWSLGGIDKSSTLWSTDDLKQALDDFRLAKGEGSTAELHFFLMEAFGEFPKELVTGHSSKSKVISRLKSKLEMESEQFLQELKPLLESVMKSTNFFLQRNLNMAQLLQERYTQWNSFVEMYPSKLTDEEKDEFSKGCITAALFPKTFLYHLKVDFLLKEQNPRGILHKLKEVADLVVQRMKSLQDYGSQTFQFIDYVDFRAPLDIQHMYSPRETIAICQIFSTETKMEEELQAKNSIQYGIVQDHLSGVYYFESEKSSNLDKPNIDNSIGVIGVKVTSTEIHVEIVWKDGSYYSGALEDFSYNFELDDNKQCALEAFGDLKGAHFLRTCGLKCSPLFVIALAMAIPKKRLALTWSNGKGHIQSNSLLPSLQPMDFEVWECQILYGGDINELGDVVEWSMNQFDQNCPSTKDNQSRIVLGQDLDQNTPILNISNDTSMNTCFSNKSNSTSNQTHNHEDLSVAVAQFAAATQHKQKWSLGYKVFGTGLNIGFETQNSKGKMVEDQAFRKMQELHWKEKRGYEIVGKLDDKHHYMEERLCQGSLYADPNLNYLVVYDDRKANHVSIYWVNERNDEPRLELKWITDIFIKGGPKRIKKIFKGLKGEMLEVTRRRTEFHENPSQQQSKGLMKWFTNQLSNKGSCKDNALQMVSRLEGPPHPIISNNEWMHIVGPQPYGASKLWWKASYMQAITYSRTRYSSGLLLSTHTTEEYRLKWGSARRIFRPDESDYVHYLDDVKSCAKFSKPPQSLSSKWHDLIHWGGLKETFDWNPSLSNITKSHDNSKHQHNLPQMPIVDFLVDSSSKTQALDQMETREEKYPKWQLGKSKHTLRLQRAWVVHSAWASIENVCKILSNILVNKLQCEHIANHFKVIANVLTKLELDKYFVSLQVLEGGSGVQTNLTFNEMHFSHVVETFEKHLYTFRNPRFSDHDLAKKFLGFQTQDVSSMFEDYIHELPSPDGSNEESLSKQSKNNEGFQGYSLQGMSTKENVEAQSCDHKQCHLDEFLCLLLGILKQGEDLVLFHSRLEGVNNGVVERTGLYGEKFIQIHELLYKLLDFYACLAHCKDTEFAQGYLSQQDICKAQSLVYYLNSNCLGEYAHLDINDDFLNIKLATTISELLVRPNCALKSLDIKSSSRFKVDQEELRKCRLLVIVALNKCVSVRSVIVSGSNGDELHELCKSLSGNMDLENLAISSDGPLANNTTMDLFAMLKEKHNLKSFTLDFKGISFEGIDYLGAMLAENSSLEKLYLTYKVLGKINSKHLMRPSKMNSDPKPCVYISLNPHGSLTVILELPRGVAQIIAQILSTSKTLTYCSVSSTDSNPYVTYEILESLKKNKTLQVLDLEQCVGLDDTWVKEAFVDLLVNYNFSLSTIKMGGRDWDIESFIKYILLGSKHPIRIEDLWNSSGDTLECPIVHSEYDLKQVIETFQLEKGEGSSNEVCGSSMRTFDIHKSNMEAKNERPQLFLSYSDEVKDFAMQLSMKLKSSNYNVIDQDSINLAKVVDECQIAIVILSNKYVGSKPSILELHSIMKSKRTNNPTLKVYPLFYKLTRKDLENTNVSTSTFGGEEISLDSALEREALNFLLEGKDEVLRKAHHLLHNLRQGRVDVGKFCQQFNELQRISWPSNGLEFEKNTNSKEEYLHDILEEIFHYMPAMKECNNDQILGQQGKLEMESKLSLRQMKPLLESLLMSDFYLRRELNMAQYLQEKYIQYSSFEKMCPLNLSGEQKHEYSKGRIAAVLFPSTFLYHFKAQILHGLHGRISLPILKSIADLIAQIMHQESLKNGIQTWTFFDFVDYRAPLDPSKTIAVCQNFPAKTSDGSKQLVIVQDDLTRAYYYQYIEASNLENLIIDETIGVIGVQVASTEIHVDNIHEDGSSYSGVLEDFSYKFDFDENKQCATNAFGDLAGARFLSKSNGIKCSPLLIIALASAIQKKGLTLTWSNGQGHIEFDPKLAQKVKVEESACQIQYTSDINQLGLDIEWGTGTNSCTPHNQTFERGTNEMFNQQQVLGSIVYPNVATTSSKDDATTIDRMFIKENKIEGTNISGSHNQTFQRSTNEIVNQQVLESNVDQIVVTTNSKDFSTDGVDYESRRQNNIAAYSAATQNRITHSFGIKGVGSGVDISYDKYGSKDAKRIEEMIGKDIIKDLYELEGGYYIEPNLDVEYPNLENDLLSCQLHELYNRNYLVVSNEHNAGHVSVYLAIEHIEGIFQLKFISDIFIGHEDVIKRIFDIGLKGREMTVRREGSKFTKVGNPLMPLAWFVPGYQESLLKFKIKLPSNVITESMTEILEPNCGGRLKSKNEWVHIIGPRGEYEMSHKYWWKATPMESIVYSRTRHKSGILLTTRIPLPSNVKSHIGFCSIKENLKDEFLHKCPSMESRGKFSRLGSLMGNKVFWGGFEIEQQELE